MTKKKVLFLYNGGTIGQVTVVKGKDTILMPPKNPKVFKDVCAPILKKFSKSMKVSFEVITTKDSTNMTPNDWQTLIYRIQKAQDVEKYDAVAIAHGTDTLPYTATALAFALHGKNPKKSGLHIPVCITGAQNPIYQEGGDGRFNLENTFRTLDEAMKHGVADVMVNFWNRVLLGCRVLKVSEKRFDAMKSPAYPDVGIIDAGGVKLELNLLRKRKDAAKKMSIAPKFGRGVVSFELAPGVEPHMILGFINHGGVSAMVLKSLGEGNVCNEGEFNLLPVIKESTKKMVPIFITTKFIGGSSGGAHYEVGYEAIKAGGVSCYDHTDVAVDVKVRWLIGNGICSSIPEFRKAMATSYAGEVSEQK